MALAIGHGFVSLLYICQSDSVSHWQLYLFLAFQHHIAMMSFSPPPLSLELSSDSFGCVVDGVSWSRAIDKVWLQIGYQKCQLLLETKVVYCSRLGHLISLRIKPQSERPRTDPWSVWEMNTGRPSELVKDSSFPAFSHSPMVVFVFLS